MKKAITTKFSRLVGNMFLDTTSSRVERVQRKLYNSQRGVVSRFSRGNASIQNGRYLTREDLEAERAQRDKYYREHTA